MQLGKGNVDNLQDIILQDGKGNTNSKILDQLNIKLKVFSLYLQVSTCISFCLINIIPISHRPHSKCWTTRYLLGRLESNHIQVKLNNDLWHLHKMSLNQSLRALQRIQPSLRKKTLSQCCYHQDIRSLKYHDTNSRNQKDPFLRTTNLIFLYPVLSFAKIQFITDTSRHHFRALYPSQTSYTLE